MDSGFQLFYYFISKAIDTLFNDVEIIKGVTLGWFFVSVFVFTVMIQFLLAIPRIRVSSGRSRRERGSDEE